MSRVVKKNPTQIHMDMHVIKFEKCDFLILDKYSLCQVPIELQH